MENIIKLIDHSKKKIGKADSFIKMNVVKKECRKRFHHKTNIFVCEIATF